MKTSGAYASRTPVLLHSTRHRPSKFQFVISLFICIKRAKDISFLLFILLSSLCFFCAIRKLVYKSLSIVWIYRIITLIMLNAEEERP